MISEGLVSAATRGLAVGIGATAFVDLCWLILERGFGIHAGNWAMVGRWVGHMREGRFVQPSIAKASPVLGELAIGWSVHYAIGAIYGVLLAILAGASWLAAPSPWPALLLAWALLAAPWLLMMPGMGMGIFAHQTPHPWVPRARSVASHTLFGLGLYLSALALAALVPVS